MATLQDDACRTCDQSAEFGRDEVAAQHEHRAAGRIARPRKRPQHPDHRIERRLQAFCIGGAAFVQNNKVDGEPFHPPVFMGPQQVADEAKMTVIVDPQQHDWQIARDARSPQLRTRTGRARNVGGSRPQRRIGKQYRTCEALK